MSLWELREVIEDQMPWWSVFAPLIIVLFAYGVLRFARKRKGR